MQWYAIQVTTQHEYKVRRHLENKRLKEASGIIGDVYIPEKEGKLIFPGYVFVQCNEWPQRFFFGCETRCKTLETVPDTEMQKMVQRVTEVIQEPNPNKKVFTEGDKVVINAGPFIGCLAVVKKAGFRKSKVRLIDGGINIEFDNRALEAAG